MDSPYDSDDPRDSGLLLTLPILSMMRPIEGWLAEEEADLLIAASSQALRDASSSAVLVEVGSYCGRSTVVLGSVVRTLCGSQPGRLFAIDPHAGDVGTGSELQATSPTFERFSKNIAEAGLTDLIVPIRLCSYQVEWSQPICFLFIDGLHDYANVARDFHHFARWLTPGAYVAFHDYGGYYVDVQRFVDELLRAGEYLKVHRAGGMMVLKKKPLLAPIPPPPSVRQPPKPA